MRRATEVPPCSCAHVWRCRSVARRAPLRSTPDDAGPSPSRETNAPVAHVAPHDGARPPTMRPSRGVACARSQPPSRRSQWNRRAPSVRCSIFKTSTHTLRTQHVLTRARRAFGCRLLAAQTMPTLGQSPSTTAFVGLFGLSSHASRDHPASENAEEKPVIAGCSLKAPWLCLTASASAEPDQTEPDPEMPARSRRRPRRKRPMRERPQDQHVVFQPRRLFAPAAETRRGTPTLTAC